jgi:hypothetical protein
MPVPELPQSMGALGSDNPQNPFPETINPVEVCVMGIPNA